MRVLTLHKRVMISQHIIIYNQAHSIPMYPNGLERMCYMMRVVELKKIGGLLKGF